MGLEGSGAEDFSFQAEVRKILRILWKAINSSYGPGREPEKTRDVFATSETTALASLQILRGHSMRGNPSALDLALLSLGSCPGFARPVAVLRSPTETGTGSAREFRAPRWEHFVSPPRTNLGELVCSVLTFTPHPTPGPGKKNP